MTNNKFMVLAVLILDHDELSGATKRQAQARVGPYVMQRKSGNGDSSKV